MCMKKSILLALLCAFVFVGCESGDAIDYSNYPIAGKSYKTELIGGNYYDIYIFSKDGTCRADGYIDDIFVGSIDDYWWWMEGDSIFIDVSPNRDYKFIDGCFHENYIVIMDFNATLVN